MEESDFEQYLNSFFERIGRFRGSNLRERLENVSERWRKVVDDSGSQLAEGHDLSDYRRDFGKIHQSSYLILQQHLSDESIDLEDKVERLILESRARFLEPTTEDGSRDALGFIIAEISVILKESKE